MIITIAGPPGSGKSTVAQILADQLNMKRYAMGDMRRKMAEERGMTIDEFNELGMKKDFTDKEVDMLQKKLGETEDNFVVDGRTSWHFIPHSFKLFLAVDPKIAAERIYKDSLAKERPEERQYASVEETEKVLEERKQMDYERYQKYYGINYLDMSHYDLVLDSSHKTPEDIVKEIIDTLPELAKT